MTRPRTMVRPALAAAILVASILSAGAEPQTTVFLVRHAEKDGEGPDPALSGAGIARADLLGEMLAEAGVSAIFSSEFKRTEQTAAPLGKRMRIPVTTVPGKDIDALLAKVRALPAGSRTLIVGHSNTVPTLAERLTGKRVELGEGDFDRLLVATVRSNGTGDLVVLRYGEAARTSPAR